jgi:hypothetical protein
VLEKGMKTEIYQLALWQKKFVDLLNVVTGDSKIS